MKPSSPTSKPTGPLIKQNNRLFHREVVARELAKADQAAKSRRTRNNSTSSSDDKNNKENQRAGLFVYAILEDGSLLADQKWQERKRNSQEQGVSQRIPPPPPPPPPGARMIWSLQKLQAELCASRTRYQQKQKLPPVPVLKPKVVVPLYEPPPKPDPSSSLSAGPVQPASTKSMSQSSSFPPETISSSSNNNSFRGSSKDKPGFHNPYCKGNNFNAPDVVSSTTTSTKTVPNGSVGRKSTFPPSVPHPPPAHNNNQKKDEFDDDWDDVLADLDDDAWISQSTSNSKPPPRRITNEIIHNTTGIFDDGPSYNTNSNNNLAGSFDYGDSSSYSNNYYSNNNNTGANNFSSTNNGYCSQHESTSGAPLCHDGLPCRILTSRSAKNPGRQFYKCPRPTMDEQCDFFQWVDEDPNGAGNGSFYDNNNSNNNNIYHQREPPYSGPGNYQQSDYNSTGMGYNNSSSSSSSSRSHNSSLVQTRLPGAQSNVDAINSKVFGHSTFREGQRKIIDEAMYGKDVFVLMPTGGGKSLCYQLPAMCCPGLSVVISPLLSLVQDQVQSMNKQGVESVFLNSSQDYEMEQREITRRLNQTTADSGVKLLYLTPEKLRHSGMIQNILKRLYEKNLISRFVIDEAHCLSDWGHDFRPDYSALNMLRESYPDVPLMALTATANQKVVDDAIRALRMKKPYKYITSFNRPNLHYQVRKKDGKVEDSICDFIIEQNQKHGQVSGVIYCLSRKDCEKLSEKLNGKFRERNNPTRVNFYHAELDAVERERRHKEWSNGSTHVLCATIAFGMGIDKPDVRFVIHHSLPKSITHYYQESGRAGRDGERAECILYYSYKDKQVLEGMIKKSSTNPYGPDTRRKIDQLYSCLRYCEDEFRCRRTLQLEHFGESFDRSKCHGTCDNCRAGHEIEKRDMTEVAQTLLNLLQSIQSQKKNGLGVTLLQLTELFRGSKSKTTTKFLNVSRLQGYDSASRFQLKKKQDIDRVAHAMIFERIIVEQSEQNKQGFASDYVRPGELAVAIGNGSRRFTIEFPKPQRKGKGRESNASSAPASSKKRKKTSPGPKRKKSSSLKNASGKASTLRQDEPQIFSLIDDDDDDDSDYEEEKAAASSSSTSVLSPEMAFALEKRITRLVSMWAEEEQMNGKNIYYWHIMNNKTIKSVVSQCPTSKEELKAIDGLGQKKIEEYGDRLINNIKHFVGSNGLGDHLTKKKLSRPTKARKLTESVGVDTTNSDDEFGHMDLDESELAGVP